MKVVAHASRCVVDLRPRGEAFCWLCSAPLGLAMAPRAAPHRAEPTPAGIRKPLDEWHPASPARMSEAEADLVIARAITAHEMRRPQTARRFRRCAHLVQRPWAVHLGPVLPVYETQLSLAGLDDRRAAFDPVAAVEVVDAGKAAVAAWWMCPQMTPSTPAPRRPSRRASSKAPMKRHGSS